MARQPRQLNAELAPAPDLPDDMTLHSNGVVMSEAWVRATAILLRGMARRDARLQAGGTNAADRADNYQAENVLQIVKIGERISLTG
ncbi:MAG: hypothetical protein H8F28_10435 [Fibrella sp.]|nr:hypothetical protein [Armatimonadota bacterium]